MAKILENKKKRVTALAKTEPVTLIMWDIILSRIN